MAIHLDKLTSIIIAVVILVIAALILVNPFSSIRNAIANSDIGNILGFNDEKAQGQATSLFDDLTSKLERCKKSGNSECICVEGKIVFPKDYYLAFDNDNSKNLIITLKTNTDYKLSEYTLNSVNGCYITSDSLAQNMDRKDPFPLNIKFGAKNLFSYKQKNHDTDLSLIFYKEKTDTDGQTRICVVDKDVARTLKNKPLC